MSNSWRKANHEVMRMSFKYCDETCPAVNHAVAIAKDELWDLLKRGELTPEFLNACLNKLEYNVKEYGTLQLRNGLNKACEDLDKASKLIQELQRGA